MDDAEPLLSVRHLVIGVASHAGDKGDRAIAVDDVSFHVRRGRVLGLVGESGSGKSLTALSIIGLLPTSARVLGGEVIFEQRNLLALSERELAEVRGHGLAMIFQEPSSALSPVHTVGWQLATALRGRAQLGQKRWFGNARRATRVRAIELLAELELPDPERLLETYPHQLSAGMRRRILIALALGCRPRLLIADEPTTGLDARTQAKVIDLLGQLTQQGASVVFITHDLAALAQIATDVVVMYAGQVVEAGPAASVLGAPQHPYTMALLSQIQGEESARSSSLPTEAEALPLVVSQAELRHGCRFADRCPMLLGKPLGLPRCTLDSPVLEPPLARHQARCFYPRLHGSEPHE